MTIPSPHRTPLPRPTPDVDVIDRADAAFDAALRARVAAGDPPLPDPASHAALRAQLLHTVSATRPARRPAGAGSLSRVRRWSRRRALTISAVVLAVVAGGGAAVASGILPGFIPGGDQIVLRAPASSIVRTGTATVDLGQRPEGSTSVELTLTCLSTGTFSFSDGATLTCSPNDLAAPPTPGVPSSRGGAGYSLPLAPGQRSTVITATDGARWSLTSTYSTHTPTDWATNANGDTYGITRTDLGGDPDLIAVAAITSTGEQGYVYARDLQQPMPTSPEQAATWAQEHPSTPHEIPVYASGGSTVIGTFEAP